MLTLPSGDHLGSVGDSTIDGSPPATQIRFSMSLDGILNQEKKQSEFTEI